MAKQIMKIIRLGYSRGEKTIPNINCAFSVLQRGNENCYNINRTHLQYFYRKRVYGSLRISIIAVMILFDKAF